MRRAALPFALLLVACVLLGAVPSTIASPQPDPVCGACGSSFEHAAEERGLAANVTHSTATVRVHENGSATWIVTDRVNRSAADRLAEDTDLLEGIARRAATEGWGLPHVYEEGEVWFRSVSIDDRTIEIRFRDPDAGERRLGLLVVDYLHSEGIRGGWILNADRFTIAGPDGTAVVNDPRATIGDEYASPGEVPEIDGGNATWRGSTAERGSALYDDVYVVYGGPGTGRTHADAVVALSTAPIWLDNLAAFVLPALVLYGLLLVGVAGVSMRAAEASLDPDRIAGFVAGLGLVGFLAAGLAGATNEPSWFAGLAAIYLVTGSIALARPATLRTTRGALALAAASTLGVGVVLSGLAVVDPVTDGALTVLRGMAFHLPLAVVPAFGLAVARDAAVEDLRSLTLAFAGALVSFALAGAVFVPYGSRPWGLVLILTLGGAVLAALLGLPLAVLAARRQAEAGRRGRAPRRP
ncbi:hypothetical protein ACFQE8_01735 [Salinirubellus sp. GCM10025818]|uniref:hypothetical protein n=1 Tax=Salinirubellus TaxID=2162630 RepID=UPI0030D50F70